MKTNIHFLSYLDQLFLERKMLQTKVVEKLEAHILCSLSFFRKSCRLWDNVEEYCRAGQPQVRVWRMRIACWTPKAATTHTGCVILTALSLQQWLNERAQCYVNTYIVCLVWHLCLIELSSQPFSWFITAQTPIWLLICICSVYSNNL